MTGIEMGEEGFVVDAQIVAEAFRIEAPDVRRLLQSGAMTSRCEKGVDEDEGRWRLVFFHGGRALRLTVDGTGALLSRATFAAPRGAGRRDA
ncbi:DUF6522 family protein [Jannaschia formosa]|uniref:DUF6522 family protein n=1 Tax=Jannaschia formosa TaxID=2259592 RepID=UPI000E1C2F12|nr:DUF6522 family protein [Jannaschia formosa]TFL17255.1 hypothetical protein DR046_15630 [Jannaschia formosa]